MDRVNTQNVKLTGTPTLLNNCALRSCQRLLSLSRSVIWASRAWSSARATRACSLAGSSSAERTLSLVSSSRERFEYVSQSARSVTLLSRRMLSWLIRSNISACCASDVAAWTARSRSCDKVQQENRTPHVHAPLRASCEPLASSDSGDPVGS